MTSLERLRNKWLHDGCLHLDLPNDNALLLFEKNNNVCLPEDFKTYLKYLNGTNGNSDNNMFEFYSIDKVIRIDNEFESWGDSTLFGDTLKSIQDLKSYYFFSNYSFQLFIFAVRLSFNKEIDNEILIISPKEHKKIANSFSEFVELYLENSTDLYFA